MTEAQASQFVKLALAGIHKEYPNKPSQVMRGPEDAITPRALHPVFYGNFDWHSSVHGHWMLVRLLREFPEAAFAGEVRRLLDGQWSGEGMEAEAAYFRVPENRSFERMYGWAWALRLAMELRLWEDPDARRWSQQVALLEREILGLAREYLPKLDWPIRCGFHPESSFALAQFLDYARATGEETFEALLLAKARSFYEADREYPAAYEPSGNDFFSPGLNVADLMRRVLSEGDFRRWLEGYLPSLAEGEAGNLLHPVQVSDPTDGHIIHLAGLNFSRCWTMRGIASVLPPEDPRKRILDEAAARHFEAGLPLVTSGHYEGEHWLATFAVYAEQVI